MKMIPLNKIFTVTYGNKFDLNKMEQVPYGEGSVNFVGRSSQNHGVSGYVKKVNGVSPYPKGSITVSLGGTKLLSSFVQLEEFYTAQNVAVLQPIVPMTMTQKLFYCLAIRHNRFRYTAFGREANRTLRTLEVPPLEALPEWVGEADLALLEADYAKPHGPSFDLPPVSLWKDFKLEEIFDIHKGKRLTKATIKQGNTPFIGAIDNHNGIRQYVSGEPSHPGNVLTVNYNGSVGEAFYQPFPFLASDDVNILYPKFKEMDPLIGHFFCTLIRREKYRFSYGRKWNLERMKESTIKLPVDVENNIDFESIRKFMKSIPFSEAVASIK